MMLAVAVVAMLAAQSAGAEDVGRELKALEQRLASSWKSGDCKAWGTIVADDWSVIHITGEILTKSQALQMCAAPTTAIEKFDIDDIVVRAFDGTAVVTGRTTVTTAGPQAVTVTLRFTDVFIRRNDGWQVVASQATRLAQ